MKIKIGDDFLDGNTLIAQTFSVNNLGSLETRQGGFSNRFSFPLSERNRNILGYPDNLNTSSRLPYTRVDAELYDGNVFIASGYLKIESTDFKTCEASFYSDNASWFNLIKDKKLTDLDLSSYDHDYTDANVAGSRNNTSGYIYPLIDYGLFGSTNSLSIDVDNFYPAIYVSSILEQIFLDIGWNVTGELIDEPMFNRMILPFSRKEFTHSAQWVEDETINEVKASTETGLGNGDFIDWPTGETLTASVFSFYEVYLYVIVTSPFSDPGGGGFDIVIEKNGSTDIGSITGITSTGTYAIRLTEESINASDTIKVRVDHASTGVMGVQSGSFITLSPSAKVFESNEVQMANTVPDIKQSEFLKYLFNLFGVVPVANTLTKTVTMYLFKNIKNREAIDWSDKIDVSKTQEVDFTELIGDYANRNVFNYLEDDNDNELNTYQSENNANLGQGVLEIDNEHIQDFQEIYEAPFAPFLNIVSFDNQLYVPQIRWLDSSGAVEEQPPPRIGLIITGISISELTGGLKSSLTVTEASGPGTNVSNWNFTWFVKAPYTATTDEYEESLSFGDVTFTNTTEGTLTNYWSEYQELLSNIKYLRASLRLDAVDINNLEFHKPVYIDKYKSYFYINSVNEFTGSDTVTEVELIKIPS